MLTRRDIMTVAATLAVGTPVHAFAQGGRAASAGPILVTVFLRGGMDGLAMVAPVDDENYVAYRAPEMRLASDGDKAALRLDGGPPGGDFRLHPGMAPLKALYDSGRVALVHAAGIMNGTRSHFAAQELVERGIGEPRDSSRIKGGWIARWLESAGAAGSPALATTPGAPDVLALHPETIAVADIRAGMNVPGGKATAAVLERLYGGNAAGPIAAAGRRTLAGIRLIDGRLRQPDGKVAPYQPANGAAYDDTEIGRGLQAVARVIRMDLPIRAFCVDMGGWDTHEGQPPRFNALAGQLARALGAFHDDMRDRAGGIVLVAMSEFGRRARSNRSNGTDHGHGGLFIVSAPGINGSRIHGMWPGLEAENLDKAVDLGVTSDVRSVLAELMRGPLRTPQAPAIVFPGFQPTRVGLV